MTAVRRALAAAVLLVGIVAPAATAGSRTIAYFETPSHNIVCGMYAGGGTPPTLECGVASGLVPPPTKPVKSCGDEDFVTDRLRLGATGHSQTFCAGDVGVLAMQGRVQTLGYGSTWRRGAFSCASQTSGLTCKNGSGHGFFLSRGSWRTF